MLRLVWHGRQRCLSLSLAVVALWTSLAWSVTSLQYTLPGTAVTFADSAQSPTRTWTLSNLLTVTGRVSAQHDKGTGAQPSLWSFVCVLQLTGTNIVGAAVEFYVAEGDGTNVAGNVGTADGALASADKRRNLKPIGVLVADQTTSNTTMVATFDNVYIPTRYFSMVIYNNTTLPLKTDTAIHKCTATPMPIQMQ